MVIERTYNIPLRKGFRLAARYKKTKKAVTTLKEFLSRHMKQPDMDKVYIGRNLNKELWKHGIKNPPCQVKVVVIKEDNGDVKAELFGFKYDHKKKDQKEKDKDKKEDDTKVAEKAKVVKKKSTSTEIKPEHHHDHSAEDAHEHEEKHEHAAGATHEHAKPTVKKVVKKKSE